MISFKDHQGVVSQLVSGLLHPSVPTSWNVVLPPVFDDAKLSEDIAAELRRQEPAPLIAVLSSDMIDTPFDYVEKLSEQWGATARLPMPTRGTSADAALQRLLMSVPADRPAVQILTRFHKILDSLDQWVLGSVRNAEQAGKLRTLTIAPFDYEELKRRWERRGKLLIASDYGDFHSLKEVELMSPQEIERVCRDRSIPRHLVDFALRHTGGYPMPFRGVIEDWIRHGQPAFKPDVAERLRDTAAQRMAPLVRQLDAPGETRYRDALIDLYQLRDEEADEAFQVLSRHPWDRLLLTEDGLRAEALGRAAVEAAIKESIERRVEVSVAVDIMTKATRMYQRKQYTSAVKLVDTSCNELQRPAYLKLLREHAEIMAKLYGSEEYDPGVDTDWRGLRAKIGEARRVLASFREKVPMCAEIERRYDELDGIASSVTNATRDGNRRVVDFLAGCVDGTPIDPRTALLLLILRLESGRTISGDASACHAILALPEQVFRVWAMWNLGLSYYTVPQDHEDIWAEVGREWPHETLTRPSSGGHFTSFELFAYFATTMALRATMKCTMPEQSLRDLAKAMSTLDVRRDAAHALTIPSRRVRTQLFELVDRWFDTLLPSCRGHVEAFSRDELLAYVEPLPVVGEDNVAIWA
ncbi:hypothetical protein [Polyangium sp. y55x31]|uniref:hypothetical protein n=1 Tax=Polyangium sp. y55x31 TaxID=3042688 RepID=UPI0024823278|nr:hypothetical protein [Polyangium sp. y55x31]MDI1484380.1 hypothetical protein [Polyangium sp. y55x31]